MDIKGKKEGSMSGLNYILTAKHYNNIVIAEETFQLTIKLPGSKGSDIKIIVSSNNSSSNNNNSILLEVGKCFFLYL